MVAAWRRVWSQRTAGETDPDFAFGFVQLSVWGDSRNPPHPDEYVAQVRWGQTANVGYVPNARLPNVFMATAIDLGATMGGCGHDSFPNLCIHPGFKQEVGRRLSLGAANLVLQDSTIYWTGPIFERAIATPIKLARFEKRMVHVIFKNSSIPASSMIEVRNTTGFELSTGSSSNPSWVAASIVGSSDATVTLELPFGEELGDPPLVRYLWSQSPCNHPHFEVGNCSVYCNGLPATPFIHPIET